MTLILPLKSQGVFSFDYNSFTSFNSSSLRVHICFYLSCYMLMLVIINRVFRCSRLYYREFSESPMNPLFLILYLLLLQETFPWHRDFIGLWQNSVLRLVSLWTYMALISAWLQYFKGTSLVNINRNDRFQGLLILVGKLLDS